MFERFIFVKRVIQAVEVIHCAVLIVNNSDEGDDFIAVIAESKKKKEKWGHLKNMMPIKETRRFVMDKWLEMDDTLPEMHIWYVCERRGALMHVTKLRKKKRSF